MEESLPLWIKFIFTWVCFWNSFDLELTSAHMWRSAAVLWLAKLVLSLLRSSHQFQDVSGWKKYIHKDAAALNWPKFLAEIVNIVQFSVNNFQNIFRVFIEFYEWMSLDQGRLTVWKHWRLGKWFASANRKPVLTSHDHFQPMRGRYFIFRAFLTNLVTTLQLTPKINSQTKQLSFSQQRFERHLSVHRLFMTKLESSVSKVLIWSNV